MKFRPQKTYPADVVFTDIDKQEYTLKLVFKRLNSVEIAEFGRKMEMLSAPTEANQEADPSGSNEKAVALLTEVVADWMDVTNENDLPVPYTPEAFKEFLLNYYTAILPIANAYIDSVDVQRKKP